MATQNLVSATLAPETKAEITQKLSGIKSQLGFLLSLDASEVHSLFKAGKELEPFLDKAHQAVEAHPEILPGVFNVAEFKKDYQLSKDMADIVAMANELAEGLQSTHVAVKSDAMAAALDVYAAVRQHKDKVSGLSTIADDMAVYFKKSKKKAAMK
ncbi:MAG: hypothetical protein HZC28_06350 [Spirochaetes bacterium]|nr:hypothetical protein [Spirochaetota bacterium]